MNFNLVHILVSKYRQKQMVKPIKIENSMDELL